MIYARRLYIHKYAISIIDSKLVANEMNWA